MNKLYKYDNWNDGIGGVNVGFEVKDKYYFGDSPESGYTEVTDEAEKAQWYLDDYPRKRSEGIAFVDTANASFMASNGSLTPQERADRAVQFAPVESALSLGHWKSALELIKDIPASPSIPQELLDGFEAQIQSYVNANYP